MTADQRQARKYFDGVLMAYQDCAEIAEMIAAKMALFDEAMYGRRAVGPRYRAGW